MDNKNQVGTSYPGSRMVVFGSHGQQLQRGTFSLFPSNALTVPGFGGMNQGMYFLAEPVHDTDSLYEVSKKFPHSAETTVAESGTKVQHTSPTKDMIGKGSEGRKRLLSWEDAEYLKKLNYSLEHPVKVSRVEFEAKKVKTKKKKHKFNVVDGQ
jgi:hypothetical protein